MFVVVVVVVVAVVACLPAALTAASFTQVVAALTRAHILSLFPIFSFYLSLHVLRQQQQQQQQSVSAFVWQLSKCTSRLWLIQTLKLSAAETHT